MCEVSSFEERVPIDSGSVVEWDFPNTTNSSYFVAVVFFHSRYARNF